VYGDLIARYNIHNHAPRLYAVANDLAFAVDEGLMNGNWYCYVAARIAQVAGS
jgi:hypothetical protein